MRPLMRVLGFLAALTVTLPAAAQEYPSRVITIVVPFPAGGPTDVVARLLAHHMGTYLKQQVIVENVGGAGGTLGAARVARSDPDGYTILLHNSSHSIAPALYDKLPYKPIENFEPIGLINIVPQTVVAKKDFPPKDFQEFIAYVKANKDNINVANAGLGSASHLCGLLLMKAIGTTLTTVSYRGTGPALNDLVGGQVDVMCDQTTNTGSQIMAGTIKVYCVTTRARVSSLPNVPACSEAGLPDFEVSVWHGLYAPAGTPKTVIDKLLMALQSSLREDAVKQRFAELGTEPIAQERVAPEALRTHLKAEIEKWGPIIKAAGVKAE